MFKESKEDLRSIQRYSKKCNVHVHARNKVKKFYPILIHIYPRSSRSFKGSATESEIISQLRRNDSITESKEADMCEKKLRDPQRHRMIIYTKRQRRDEFEYPTEIKSSGQEQMSSEHSRKLTLGINQMSKSETFHPIATIIAVRISNCKWRRSICRKSHATDIILITRSLLKPKQHCPLMLEVLREDFLKLIRIVKYRKSSKINIKKPYWRGGAIYYLRYISAMAEESKARKQAKQPDAIINEIDQLTDSEANCPECKNATHASEYMEELKIFCVPEILKSRVSRNGHFALRLIANMHN
ncbi:unnamed protein product [Rhizophagus irregularis]|nr:unnamed protein product [Rhizophagus irregularis]